MKRKTITIRINADLRDALVTAAKLANVTLEEFMTKSASIQAKLLLEEFGEKHA
jgi:uncharacterized protein (DUF1778 family)